MSETLSAAEKRKLLREKRAAKMAAGGSRINRILGTPEAEQKGEQKNVAQAQDGLTGSERTTQAAPRPNTAASGVTGAGESSNIRLRPSAGKSQTKNNRISVILNEDDDPPVSGLDEYEHEPEVSLESDSPLDEFVSNENAEQEIEQLLNRMLQSSAQDASHPHAHGEKLRDEDLFNKDISSILAGMGSGQGFPGFPGLPGMEGMPGLGGKSLSSPRDLTKARMLQSTYALFRFVIIWVLINMNMPYSALSSYAIFPYSYNLWLQFLCIEVIFGLLYLLLRHFSVFPSNTIMSFDISSFGYANSAFTAYSLARSFFNDVCCLVVIVGLASYLSAN